MLEKISLALFGAIVGWLLSWHRYRVAENANLISDHISDMERFAEALRVHWTTSYANADPDEHIGDIAKIKAQHSSISSFYGEAQSRLGMKRFRDYQVKQLRLFRVGMGGDFESVGRKMNEDSAIDSQIIAWDIIQSLRAARREQYGLLAASRSAWNRWFRSTNQYQ